MKIVAIVQARMGSTRLPGKVLRVLGSDTVLAHVIRRVKGASNIDAVVVATTSSPRDKPIVEAALHCGAGIFCGSEEDVLSRYYFAAKHVCADVVVRITSDCPLLDFEVLRNMVDAFYIRKRESRPLDYLSNTLTRTFPRGLDAEILTFHALERAHQEAGGPAEREHVTPYIYHHPEKFRIDQYTNDVDLSHYRWTLDTEEDWLLLVTIFGRLGNYSSNFRTSEILELFAKEPELANLNAHITQKFIGR